MIPVSRAVLALSTTFGPQPRSPVRCRPRGRLFAWLPLCLVSACSTLSGTDGVAPGDATARGVEAAASAAPDASASAPAGLSPTALNVQIDAPEPIRALLSRYLDLARLSRLRDDESLDETEWRRLMAAAPAQARELLQTEGYFEAVVTVRREPGATPRVRLSVEPGPRIRVASVDVQAEGALAERAAAGDAAALATRKRLNEVGPLHPGRPFRNPDWSETKLQWLTTLRADGHATATLSASRAEVDVAAGQAALSGRLDSGPLFRAGPLKIVGLNHHDAATVQHLAGFGPGEPLTETLLLDYQERLQKSGLFDGVSVGFDPKPEDAAGAPVSVRLRELPLQDLTLGVGVSTDTGPHTKLEYLHRRPFGWAVTADNKIEWGAKTQRWTGDLLTHPGEGFKRKLLGVLFERVVGDTDTVLNQRLRLGQTQDAPQVERVVFLEALRSRQAVNDGPVFDARALSANLNIVLRRLDSQLVPTRGFSLSAESGAGQATSNTGRSGPFARLYARFTGYLPLGSNWFARGRIEAAQIFKRDGVDVPDSLGFRAGGDESVRGYAYRSLTPSITFTSSDGTIGTYVRSGNKLLTLSAEVAHPVSASLPSVLGALFIDAGRAVNHWTDYKPALGYGTGVRWNSPIGPVRADLAWGQEVHKWRLHLTVGVTF